MYTSCLAVIGYNMDMQPKQQDYDVVTLNEQGEVIGSKRRDQVDKVTEILHAVHMIGVTANKEVIVGVIPEEDQSGRQEIFEGMFGNIIAALVRANETPEQTAKRAVQTEIFQPETIEVTYLGQAFDRMENGIQRLHTVYYYIHYGKFVSFNRQEVAGAVLFHRNMLEERIEKYPHMFAPSFLRIWQRYQHILPV